MQYCLRPFLRPPPSPPATCAHALTTWAPALLAYVYSCRHPPVVYLPVHHTSQLSLCSAPHHPKHHESARIPIARTQSALTAKADTISRFTATSRLKDTQSAWSFLQPNFQVLHLLAGSAWSSRKRSAQNRQLGVFGQVSKAGGPVWSGLVRSAYPGIPLRLLDLHAQPACHPCSLGTPYPPSPRPGHTISSSSLLFARPVSPTVSRPRGPFWSDHPTRHSSNFCPTVGCVSPSRPCYSGLIIPTLINSRTPRTPSGTTTTSSSTAFQSPRAQLIPPLSLSKHAFAPAVYLQIVRCKGYHLLHSFFPMSR